MRETRHFSRVRFRQDASVGALLPLLGLDQADRDAGTPRPAASHALVWSLFADRPDRRRDFLYRETDDGTIFILSSRPPVDRHALFHVESKAWEPDLRRGDRLSFALRANPIVRRKVEGRSNSAKDDVVMHALHKLGSKQPRRERRLEAIEAEGRAWLERIGMRGGFLALGEQLKVDGYRQHRLPRSEPQRAMRFSSLDFEGVLEVTEPALLVESVAAGFGSARAYGCGLMLLRRA